MKLEKRKDEDMDLSKSKFGNSRYTFWGESIPGEDIYSRLSIIYDQYGDKFLTKKIRYYFDEWDADTGIDQQIHEHYHWMILNPPVSDMIIWPKDLIIMGPETTLCTTATVVNNYQVYATDAERDSSNYGLVFADRDYHSLKSLKKVIQELKRRPLTSNALSYCNPDIIKIVYGIILCIAELNDSGYYFYDFSFDRFLVDSRNNVYLDFSNLIFHESELKKLQRGWIHLEEPREFPLDFVEPWLFRQDQEIQEKVVYVNEQSMQQVKAPVADEITQNFGLCAMVFYLLYGIYAYDGKLHEKTDTDTPEGYYDFMRSQIENPIFIFDPEDTRNSLGVLDYDIYYQELWNKSPQQLKDVFINILRRENAERTNQNIETLKPRELLKLLTDINLNNYRDRDKQ